MLRAVRWTARTKAQSDGVDEARASTIEDVLVDLMSGRVDPLQNHKPLSFPWPWDPRHRRDPQHQDVLSHDTSPNSLRSAPCSSCFECGGKGFDVCSPAALSGVNWRKKSPAGLTVCGEEAGPASVTLAIAITHHGTDGRRFYTGSTRAAIWRILQI